MPVRKITIAQVKPGEAERLEEIVSRIEKLGGVIEAFCPDGKEKALASAKLQEVLMWAAVSITG